jgi:enoyl-[acyl-carrier protein] reductase I
MLGIDLSGKRALVAGVADDGGFGFAIAKALAEAGAEIVVGTWPPAYVIFTKMLERGKFDASLEMADGSKLGFAAILPLDADYDTYDQIPEDVRASRRYRDHGDVSIDGAGKKLVEQFGDAPLDIVVHSLANGPEVTKPLLETSRAGYLGALGVSSYSFVSMIQRYSPLLSPGGAFLALSYLAAERVVPGYGGGMSSAKAALEADARYLAYEAGRKWGHRVNVISAGPFASRAASAIGEIDKMIEHVREVAPIAEPITADQVGHAAAFLCSPLAAAITGATVYVDNGYNIMGAGSGNL